MRFVLTEDQQMVRDMVSDFAQKEIAPGTEEREKNSVFPRDIVTKGAELGLCGITVDEKYGGAGFDGVQRCSGDHRAGASVPLDGARFQR